VDSGTPLELGHAGENRAAHDTRAIAKPSTTPHGAIHRAHGGSVGDREVLPAVKLVAV
jgi:hypothetical protein